MSSALLWFGLLGAPAAWVIQLTVNYSLEEWFACAPSTSAEGLVLGTSVPTMAIVVSVALTIVAITAGLAAVNCYRRLTSVEGNGAATRALWMARAGIMNSVLYLILIVASFGPPLLLDVCELSP